MVLLLLLRQHVAPLPDDPSPVDVVLTEDKPAQAAYLDNRDLVEKHANAAPANLNVDGVHRPTQAGFDGSDPHSGPAGSLVPGEGELTAGDLTGSGHAVVVAAIGPAPPQATTRQPGDDERTAVEQQDVQCGRLAKTELSTHPLRHQSRVVGFMTDTQAAAAQPKDQARVDRRLNPNYIVAQRVFVRRLLTGMGVVVVIPAGMTVNIGDVIEQDGAYIDPTDPCQYIPNVAVSHR
ncbi:hypothetical protein [Bradyrhizobium sp. USDA 4353]